MYFSNQKNTLMRYFNEKPFASGVWHFAEDLLAVALSVSTMMTGAFVCDSGAVGNIFYFLQGGCTTLPRRLCFHFPFLEVACALR